MTTRSMCLPRFARPARSLGGARAAAEAFPVAARVPLPFHCPDPCALTADLR